MTAASCAMSKCSSTALTACSPPYSRLREAGWNGHCRASCHTHQHRAFRKRRRRRDVLGYCRLLNAGGGLWTCLLRFPFAFLFIVAIFSRRVDAANATLPSPLLFDTSEPPMQQRMHANGHHDTTLHRRNVDNIEQSQLHKSNHSSRVDLPSPFDSNLGNNFTSPSCPAFFETFLNDPAFQNCLPLSLLLQTSNAFFDETRSIFRLTQTLDATCNVNFRQCTTVMSNYANEIQSQSNCGADLRMQNPMAEQAYNGFIAYQPLYHAGCLKDNRGNYCFANAATNASAPTSSYIYYLPLGVPLPSITRPTCNACLQNTMAVFSAYSSNSIQPLSSDYDQAAQLIDGSCGSSYIGYSTVPATGAASSTLPIPSNGLVFLASLWMICSLLF